MNDPNKLTPAELDRLFELACGYRDGAIEDAEVAELDAMLADSPAALEAFVEMGMQVAELSCSPERERAYVRLDQPNRLGLRPTVLAITACAAAMIGLFFFQEWRPDLGQQAAIDVSAGASDPLQLSKGVARIYYQEEAIASSGSTELYQHGDWLPRGLLNVAQGRVMLVFDSGAEVQIQSPAQLELISSNQARLARGRVSCRVPDEAIGFHIDTPQSEVIDRGTEFVLDVLEEGTTELHVVKGLVDIRPTDSDVFAPIRTQEAVRCEQSLEFVEFESDRFSLPNEIQSEPVRFVHWNFEESDPSRDASGSMKGGPYPLEFVGREPKLVRGVFGSCLRLSGRKEGAISGFSGISGHAPRTIAFWCRVPRNAAVGKNYAMIGWGEMKDNSKWVLGWNQHARQGTVGALRTEFGRGYVTGSTDLRDGRWHHIASVWMGGLDADVATHLRLYVDGALQTLSKSRSNRVATVTAGERVRSVTLGLNVNRPQAENSFYGNLDEVYVFDRALLPGEIRKLVAENQPPPTLLR